MAAGCSAPPVAVEPPPGTIPAACKTLRDALPDELDGRSRRETSPDSPATAAWGDPPVRLRCGVARPATLTQTSALIEVNGVEWYVEQRPGAYVFTTSHREPRIELRVPGSTPPEQATAALVDLAEPVRSTTGRGPL